jgi:heme/copper-type cytochrome/quinol oxidase subunit 2
VSAVVLVFALCVLSCVVGQAAILASVVRRRASVAAANVPRPRMAIEILWALIPAVALAFLLTATWVRVREHARIRPDVMMKVAQ